MRSGTFALLVALGVFAVVTEAGIHGSFSPGELAQIQPEGGILGNFGEYIFESGENIKLICTLTEAGLSEGLITSDLRFQFPSGDVVEPNSTWNETTVSLIIVNASANDSGRFYCGNVSDDNNLSMLDTAVLEIGYPPLELKSWRCWSMQLELLYCQWSEAENPVHTDYFFYIQTDGSVTTECRQTNPNSCEATKGQTPPYRPGETEANITVRAENPLGNPVFIYPFEHYRNVKIEELENVEVEAVDAEALDVTWDLPADLFRFNVSIVHNIQWAIRPNCTRDARYVSETNYTIPGHSDQQSWNYTLTGLIPNTIYDVKMKAIVLDAEFPDLWSVTSEVYNQTLPKAPNRSPGMPPGSFYVDRIDDSHRNIYLYWIPLKDWERNSHDFFYLVEGLEIPTRKRVQPSIVTDTFAVFRSLSTELPYKFSIVSRNSMGTSPQPSMLHVEEEKYREPSSAFTF
ncbi:unnamed protein product [Darwinula stevensoni]|uniref:Uncharacterized protein n=1 Tax=Darwinula stevensoni TaxID=69355 RepID=A0A7R9A906_9CRUS|nr:unnamed protein product [Darwinula stevensoni]CAG0896934.1 unnamed protein product [Darwinula stevensoni]